MDYKAALLRPRKPRRNWLHLPADVMVSIMLRIDWYDVLLNVTQVCKYWHVLSKDPSIWQVIEFRRDEMLQKLREKKGIIRTYNADKFLNEMAMNLICQSRGHLLDLYIQNFGSDHLFQCIYQRSRQLRRLRLEDCVVYCHDHNISSEGLVEMISNLPLLEELQLTYTAISGEDIEVVGRCCPHLESFTLNQRSYGYTYTPECDDEEALAIAKTMPGLRNLQLFSNRMTVIGLKAILNNCHYLEYLDLRHCFNIGIVLEPDDNGEVPEPDLERKLRQQIKHVRFPYDSTQDYEFDDKIYDPDNYGYYGYSDYGYSGSDYGYTGGGTDDDYESDDDWTFSQNTWAYM